MNLFEILFWNERILLGIIIILIVLSNLSLPSKDQKIGMDYNELDTKIYSHKSYETNRGELVKSRGELVIANYLADQNIEYIYEKGIAFMLPDFYLLQ